MVPKPTYTLQPAIFQMVDATRGDLFAVVADKAHHVVRAEHSPLNSNQAVTKFVPGWIGYDQLGIPSVMSLLQKDILTTCTPLLCQALCPACCGIMRSKDNVFICEESDCMTRL